MPWVTSAPSVSSVTAYGDAPAVGVAVHIPSVREAVGGDLGLRLQTGDDDAESLHPIAAKSGRLFQILGQRQPLPGEKTLSRRSPVMPKITGTMELEALVQQIGVLPFSMFHPQLPH